MGEYVQNQNLGYIDAQAEVSNDNHYAHTDGLWVTGKDATAIEIKSIHPDAIDNTERKNNGQWVPYPHHALQVSQFMYLAREQGGYTLPNGSKVPVVEHALIFYISKDGRTRISPIALKDYEGELTRRMKLLDEAWASQDAPPKQPDPESYPCQYGGSSACQFWDWCWGTVAPRTPKGSLIYLKTQGINVVRKAGAYYIKDTSYTAEEIVHIAVKKHNEIHKQ